MSTEQRHEHTSRILFANSNCITCKHTCNFLSFSRPLGALKKISSCGITVGSAPLRCWASCLSSSTSSTRALISMLEGIKEVCPFAVERYGVCPTTKLLKLNLVSQVAHKKVHRHFVKKKTTTNTGQSFL